MPLLLLLFIAATAVGQDLTLDARFDDPFWRNIPTTPFSPALPGVPVTLGGEVRIAQRGRYLCLAASLPEPNGRVLARSQGRNPVWERDALESPEVEDRLLIHHGGNTVAINPWGAYQSEAPILRATRVTAGHWFVEAAVPLDTPVDVTVERVRSRRALAPEFRWTAPAYSASPTAQPAAAPLEKPDPIGNTDPPLEVGRVSSVPALVPQWDHPAWNPVPEFTLLRNEPEPRLSQFPAHVKWMHDGRSLALLLRVEEPDPVVARNGGRDSNVTNDDHFALYLATSGAAYLEIAINTAGALRDARATGPRYQRSTAWNANIGVITDIRYQHWVARIDIPLAECAAALGESGIPTEWRAVLVRHRAARSGDTAETASLPTLDGAGFSGPIRYRRLRLSDAAPSAVAVPRSPDPASTLDPHVWTSSERRRRATQRMLEAYLDRRAHQAILAERQAFDRVRTRVDWERFRDERMAAFRKSLGQFPPDRPPLETRFTATHTGDGYLLRNVLFQVRPHYWMAANLYQPAGAIRSLPAILIVHSQHYPKTQGELHDMGELWARTGAAVLIIERPGFGERTETTPAYRQAYASRHTFTKQLFLAGESHSAWGAWDVIRSVDFLHSLPFIDKNRIILLGSVAGGGEPAALAAALDQRITAVAPYNYDQGHIRVHGDSPNQTAAQFHPWLIAASIAPRKFIRAFEFGWEGAEEPDYPSLWVDGMARSRKIWGFYNAHDNLASAQAYGLIRLSMERAAHCFSIGPQQRLELYPLLQRWFQIPYPSAIDLAILPDSQLSSSPQREAARLQEATRRRTHADLLSIPPAANAQITRRGLHQIAHDLVDKYLAAAGARPANALRSELAPLLGDIEPNPNPAVEHKGTREHPHASVEALALTVEEGIHVPLFLLRPRQSTAPTPVVVAVAQGGKERFLASRSAALAALLKAGIAVCLADVRGTGETTPSASLDRLASLEFDLGRNLLGARLKDLRTVLAWLRSQPNVDPARVALWGESFSSPNPETLFLDELENEMGPQIQRRADLAGPHLALFAALYEPTLQTTIARGALSSYQGVLAEPFTYTTLDASVLGILKVADIPGIAKAIGPTKLHLENQVDGRNIARSSRPSNLLPILTTVLRAQRTRISTAHSSAPHRPGNR